MHFDDMIMKQEPASRSMIELKNVEMLDQRTNLLKSKLIKWITRGPERSEILRPQSQGTETICHSSPM